jgi:hypothetical protein
LLERTLRALTLKEVTQQFDKNPAYPMVPSVDDIRRAVHELLIATVALISRNVAGVGVVVAGGRSRSGSGR